MTTLSLLIVVAATAVTVEAVLRVRYFRDVVWHYSRLIADITSLAEIRRLSDDARCVLIGVLCFHYYYYY